MAAVAACFFGDIHRGIGILDEGFAVAAMIGVDADADAASHVEGMPPNRPFRSHGSDDALRDHRRVGTIFERSERNDEFISPDPCDRILFSGPSPEPLRDLLK